MTRRWAASSVTTRAVLVTCLVAVVAVVITAAVALPLVTRSANEDARITLAAKARVAANALGGRDTAASAAREDQRAQRIVNTLRADNVQAVLIRNGQAEPAGLPPRIVNEVANGGVVSQKALFQGTLMMVEGRPSGGGDGIVLLQPVSTINLRTAFGRLWLALLAGLAAGLLAGVMLARRLGRPLRDVAVAARRLSAGDRGARAPTDAPLEVAAVSHALNDLATALTTSENRQRMFLMSVSHELRTPLTTMKGYAEALADGVIGPDGAQRAGQTMLAESEHLDRLVEDLLVLARLEADDFPLEVMPVELTSLVANAAESWAVRAGAAAGPVIRTELPEHAVLVNTDPGRLRQVIDGLMENAMRVVPVGAPIVLAVRPAQLGPDEPTVGFPVAGGQPAPARPGTRRAVPGYAVLEVRDGGPGFTDDDLRVVFERGALYERYKGIRAVGSGLGLALAERLVRRLGGAIEAGHAPEGGARFAVRLPTSGLT
jgi:two-component system, OmpR family, sensor kinase